MNRRTFLKQITLMATLPIAPVLTANETKAAPMPQVTRRRYKNTDWSLPMLGFGMMRLPRLSDDKPDLDYVKTKELFDRAMAAGANYFDTAYFYHQGHSELAVANVLKQYPRESYILADKMPISLLKTPADVERIWNEQLSKTQAGYFDVYLLHALNRDLWQRAQDFKVYEFLKQKQAEGKIKKLGFSFHDTPEVLETIASAKAWDIALIQINYLDWTAYRSKEQYDILTKYNIPVLVMEPLRGGRLANLPPDADAVFKNTDPTVSTASWAMRYVGSLPNVVCVLSGMSCMEHLDDNIKTFTDFRPLTAADYKVVDTALGIYQNAGFIPCTDCRYCQPCPAEVNIAQIFTVYNQTKSQGVAAFRAAYEQIPEDNRASSCLECEACLKKCPQKLNIPQLLKHIDAEATA